jgi:hypothetical protein
MVYFLPVAAAPLVAVALTRTLPARLAAGLGVALAVTVAVLAWPQAANVRGFYLFANGASLRGLDSLEGRLRPGEVVVTDRCWSFLTTWLVHTRTLAALDPSDIQPKAELRSARDARAVLDGSRRGREIATRLGVRYAVTDPTCVDAGGREIRPPGTGSPIYVSERLAVLRLPSRRRKSTAHNASFPDLGGRSP